MASMHIGMIMGLVSIFVGFFQSALIEMKIQLLVY